MSICILSLLVSGVPNGEDEEESGHFEMALILRILLLGYSFVKFVLDIAEYEPSRGLADIFSFTIVIFSFE